MSQIYVYCPFWRAERPPVTLLKNRTRRVTWSVPVRLLPETDARELVREQGFLEAAVVEDARQSHKISKTDWRKLAANLHLEVYTHPRQPDDHVEVVVLDRPTLAVLRHPRAHLAQEAQP